MFDLEHQQHQLTRLPANDVLTIIEQGTLGVQGLMPYSSNYTLLVSLDYAGETLLAVYKPRRGERPLWDFPRGTLYQREVAAFVVDAFLGFDLVPPTVVRDGPYGVGAVQLFIPSDPEEHLFTMQREGCYHDELLQLAAFDCVINNADRKSGHCLKGFDNRLWAIDHGIAFHVEDKLRTVLWDFVGMHFPDDVRAALNTLHRCLTERRAPVVKQLCNLLSPDELHAMHERVELLLLGGTYPEPGPGPNVPWPPV